MSIVRSVDATMKNFKMNINSKPVLLDHIKQTNVYSGIGIIGVSGDVTITYDMFKMLDKTGQDFNPVGKTIDFEIEDNKTSKRNFEGIITSWRKIKNIKASLVVLAFEKKEYVKLGKVRWWKCFKDKTIVEMFKEFLEAHDLSLHLFDESLFKQRGTWWEYFAIPQTMPTLQFFLDELSKDNLLLYHNPETGGINIASWWDISKINDLNKVNQEFIVEGHLAKFDESKNQWKESTFVFGKQIDSRSPWKIMEWQNTVAPDIWMNDMHSCVFYSALKKGLEFKPNESKPKPNDINLPEESESYTGNLLAQNLLLAPEPAYEALTRASELPAMNLKEWETGNNPSNQNIYPRYMFYRMRESYAQYIKWIKSDMLIAGSCKAVVPLTTVMVSQFENAMNANKDELAKKDKWQSGLYAITDCQLMITGNNIMAKYKIRKPFGYGSSADGGTPESPAESGSDVVEGDGSTADGTNTGTTPADGTNTGTGTTPADGTTPTHSSSTDPSQMGSIVENDPTTLTKDPADTANPYDDLLDNIYDDPYIENEPNIDELN